MTFEDFKIFIKDFRKKPLKTIFLFVVFFIVFIIVVWLNGLIGEKGRQHAIPQKDSLKTVNPKINERSSVKMKKEEPSISIRDIKDNQNTQINVNSPNSTQIINQTRNIKEAFLKRYTRGNLYILRITFIQTDGIWSDGTKLRIMVQLSGSYKNYRFIQGLPTVQFGLTVIENKDQGLIDYSTESSPLNVPIILEIESESYLNIIDLYVEPLLK